MLDGKMLTGIFEHERLKPTIIRTNQENVQNLVDVRQVMNTGLKFNQHSSKFTRYDIFFVKFYDI